MPHLISGTKSSDGFKNFKKVLLKKKPELLHKKYFCITIWSLGCKPCIDEISVLDSLPGEFNKSIACVMISAHSNKAVKSYLKNQNIEICNFFLINEMMDFILGIYNELGAKNLTFPLHVILDKTGNILAYFFGPLNNRVKAIPIINYINSLA